MYRKGGASAYAASKFAVQAITDSLRLELAPFGIDVTIVDLGAKKAAKLARMPVWLRDWLISRFMSSGIQDSGRAASPRFGVKNEATNA